ncbi:MAG: hypothetical protein A3F83_09145 [Candidatus Glassbacteria bacterium RIFCSPLOWO2_12_FULL_58_11]|uniref:Uncharacterized protein n=1 Tax=Candidatus Glassbacteria bacterium RIFCSPLOWO2_12_FULL_58_11 TaxID=1817867 RepID=A0A1F5YTI1_9BACT|nr:MAG: hypothetical protein A3F83_09145 [Candidatus Glassbacteria bacterium RIFCSPLOWO2_12_FULL_58_11]
MYRYFRKLILLGLLLLVYVAISFWVPYSKLWLMQDLMQTQARLFFASQSGKDIQDFLIKKAEALDVPLKREEIKVETINGEIIYFELQLNVPLDILFYHTSLHFEPKIFGLIRGFDLDKNAASGNLEDLSSLAELSDSTKNYLRNKTLRNYFEEFFAH